MDSKKSTISLIKLCINVQAIHTPQCEKKSMNNQKAFFYFKQIP